MPERNLRGTRRHGSAPGTILPGRGRRAVLLALALALAVALSACDEQPVRTDPPVDPTEVLERFEVAAAPGPGAAAWGTGYLAFPHTLRLRSGEVLVSWRDGAAHIAGPSRILVARYRDEGGALTLVETGELLDTEDDEREAGLVELADGTVVANAFTGRFVDYTPEGETWRVVVLRSRDGGRTWADTVQVHGADVRDASGRSFHWLALRGAVVQTPSGRLLMPVYGIRRGDQRHSAHVLRSDDGGLTWRYGALVARDPDRRHHYNEMSLLVDGSRVVAVFRSEDGYLRQAESEDEGTRWGRVRVLDVWGVPPHLLRLADGRVLLSHGYRRGRMGVRYALSLDAGRSWERGIEGVLDGSSASADCGYPSTVELGDGSLLTVYYLTHSQEGATTTGIHAVRYRVPTVPPS